MLKIPFKFSIKSWRSILSILGISVVTVPFFYNCTPAQFENSSAKNLSLSASSLSTLACGTHAAGERWWEVDSQTQSYTCSSGAVIQVRYSNEKICSNGVASATGQRVIDSSSPACPGPCASQTQKWFMSEGQIQQTLTCSSGQTFNNLYQRLVEYSCVNNVSVATGTVQSGNLLSGQTCSSAGTPCGNDSNGVARVEGSVWQESISNLASVQSCPNSGTGSVNLNCQQLVEYQCTNGLRQLTSRPVVTLSCSAMNNCSPATPVCVTSGGVKQYLETWSTRITPDFVDAGACSLGGDLSITSQRLETYTCNNGQVITQQVVRGPTVSQTGQCGPKSCSISNGTGQQQWTANGGVGAWSSCQAVSCNSGYEVVQGQCLANCSSTQLRNPATLACQTPVCATGGQSQSCSANNGTGTQACSDDRFTWGTCSIQSCNAGYVMKNGACAVATTIQIERADYGHNFGIYNNATAHMSSVCNGKYSCSYYITVNSLGDPKWGWSKDFYVIYNCHDGVQRTGYANPEANTRTVTISCPAQ